MTIQVKVPISTNVIESNPDCTIDGVHEDAGQSHLKLEISQHFCSLLSCRSVLLKKMLEKYHYDGLIGGKRVSSVGISEESW